MYIIGLCGLPSTAGMLAFTGNGLTAWGQVDVDLGLYELMLIRIHPGKLIL